jgi:hypothetical protein
MILFKAKMSNKNDAKDGDDNKKLMLGRFWPAAALFCSWVAYYDYSLSNTRILIEAHKVVWRES